MEASTVLVPLVTKAKRVTRRPCAKLILAKMEALVQSWTLASSAVVYLGIVARDVKKQVIATQLPAKMEARAQKQTLVLNASVHHSGTV